MYFEVACCSENMCQNNKYNNQSHEQFYLKKIISNKYA